MTTRVHASNRMSLADYRQQAGLGPVTPAPGANKYRAQRTVGVGGRTYDSKAEARMAAELERQKVAGEIAAWVPQVSLPIGPGEAGKSIRYQADALVVLAVLEDGSFVGRLVDRKGLDTPNSRTKRAALRALYGLDVQVLTK
jgi:hypothetical protein